MNAEKLARDGIVVIDGYLGYSQAEKIRREIDDILENNQLKVIEGETSYQELASAEEPVIRRRSGKHDDGMLDIFNMQLIIPELREIKEDSRVKGIINHAADVEYKPENLNIYVNRSVTNTRAYHADTYSGKYKAFVYLTDVPDESYGPFSYVKRSQAPGKIKRKVTAWVNRMRGLPRIAPKATGRYGTSIILRDITAYLNGRPGLSVESSGTSGCSPGTGPSQR